MDVVLPLVALAYAALLFGLAWGAERRTPGRHWVDRPQAYALALAVYCTSWTFFGGVGSAATGGWTYLPIYLGPALVFLFAGGFLRRLAQAVRAADSTSIADFLSARFGRSRALAALVTTLALLAALPYTALQLKSLAMATSVSLAGDITAPAAPAHDSIALAATALAAFAILFGTRRVAATGRNRGLMAAVSVEAVVKLAALLAVGLYALVLLWQAPGEVVAAGAARLGALFAPAALRPDFITITLLSMAAILCLPRQFYMGFVEYRRPEDLRAARRLLPLYLAVTALIVLPITLAGLALLPAGATPDLYVLDLPLWHGAAWLALLAFLGGLSAATGMVVVECVALSTMIANDLIGPLLLRGGGAAGRRTISADGC